MGKIRASAAPRRATKLPGLGHDGSRFCDVTERRLCWADLSPMWHRYTLSMGARLRISKSLPFRGRNRHIEMNQYARYAKGCMAALIFAAVACSSGCASAPAAEPTPAEESPCRQGPFETDRGKIVTAIASLPRVSTKPSRERRSSRQPDVW